MKVIVVMLAVSLTAILSCGPGVPTQDSGPVNNTQAVPVIDGNKNPALPVSTISTARLNPAHGQPGHRCDIGVGQPLDGKPATAVNPLTTTTTPVTKPATTSPAPFVTPGARAVTNPATNILPTTATGLNPAHGQPGHRCDIQVGQPLNSKPPTTQSTTLPNPTIPGPAIAPAINTTPVAPGMNPKHGQPGHRCDIPVGKPLNSKPAQTSLPTTPATPLK